MTGEDLLKLLIEKFFKKRNGLHGAFPEKLKLIVHYRPGWLNKMEIDFYLPQYNLGFEFQGEQHYSTTKFGNKKKVQRQIQRDRKKIRLCSKQGVRLIQIGVGDLNLYEFMKRIQRAWTHIPTIYKENFKIRISHWKILLESNSKFKQHYERELKKYINRIIELDSESLTLKPFIKRYNYLRSLVIGFGIRDDSLTFLKNREIAVRDNSITNLVNRIKKQVKKNNKQVYEIADNILDKAGVKGKKRDRIYRIVLNELYVT